MILSVNIIAVVIFSMIVIAYGTGAFIVGCDAESRCGAADVAPSLGIRTKRRAARGRSRQSSVGAQARAVPSVGCREIRAGCNDRARRAAILDPLSHRAG